MCNDFGNHISYSGCLAAFSQTGIPARWPDAIPNPPAARDDIWPTDNLPAKQNQFSPVFVKRHLVFGDLAPKLVEE